MTDTRGRRAARRQKTDTGVIPLHDNDQFGKRSMTGSTGLYPERRLRRWTAAKIRFIHRVKNGIYDPFTYFHLVRTLANLAPGQQFSSAELVGWLNEKVPTFEWDSVTVGRILSDLQDSFSEANPQAGAQPLVKTRTYSGALYETTDYPAARAVLVALMDDLVALGNTIVDLEQKGEPWRQLASPLTRCPSIADIARMDLATAV